MRARVPRACLCLPFPNARACAHSALSAPAVASLCNYANLCSRVIPLVRDKAAWLALYGKEAPGSDTLPTGCTHIYMSRGWCRLEIVAALCPKRFSGSGGFRPGPVNLRIRYHHDPNDVGMGPVLGVKHLLDPRAGKFTSESDVKLVQPVLEAIADEYHSYDQSGSAAWSATLNVSRRPAWLIELAHRGEEDGAQGKYKQVAPSDDAVNLDVTQKTAENVTTEVTVLNVEA